MAAENEPAKQLLPYLQRADELQKHEPLVAYYCILLFPYSLSDSINQSKIPLSLLPLVHEFSFMIRFCLI